MKKNGYLFIVVALTAIALIGFHATAFGADCTSICQDCHTATAPTGYEVASTAHPAIPGAPVMCIECHQQNYATCNNPLAGGIAHSGADWTANIVPIACKGCHNTTLSPCAPYITDDGLDSYASQIHRDILLSPDDVLTSDQCLPLDATGTISVGTTPCPIVSFVTGPLRVCEIGVGGVVSIVGATAPTDADTFVWWGDGAGIENDVSFIHSFIHTYNNVGKFQVIQTVKNACGEKDQQIMIVNVTGGGPGKGTIALSNTGATVVSYNVYEANSSVSITSGEMPRNVILDAGTYDIKVGLPSGIVLPGTPGVCSGPTAAVCLRNADCPTVFGVQETCSVTPTAPTCMWTAGGTACVAQGAITCPDVAVTAGGTVAVVGTCSP